MTSQLRISFFLKTAGLGLLIAAFANPSHAEQIKVIKAKGNKGIVQFPSGMTPRNGDTFNISTGSDATSSEASAGSSSGAGAGRRDYSLGLSGYMSKKTSLIGTQTAIANGTKIGYGIAVMPGFNLGGTFEVGPEMTLIKVGTLSWAFGAFVDYNIIKNEPGVEFVPGITVAGKLEKGSTMTGTGSVFCKFFVLGNSTTAIRVDAGATMTHTGATATVTAGNTMGFGLAYGLSSYF